MEYRIGNRQGGNFKKDPPPFSFWWPDVYKRNQEDLGGGFKDFLFSPLSGEDCHVDQYFSKGLKPPTSPTRYEKTLIFPHNSANTSCTLIGGSKETNKIWSYPTISHGFVGYFLSLRLMLQKSKGPTLRLDVTKKPL